MHEVTNSGTWDWNPTVNQAAWSQGAWAVFGLQAESQPLTADLWEHCLHPEDRVRAVRAVLKALRSQDDYFDRYRIIMPSGDIRWIESQGRVLRNDTGKAVRMLGIVLDITERQRVEDSLRESEERFRLMAELVPEILFTSTPEGLDEYLNPRFYEYTGLAPASREGLRWSQTVHDEDLDAAMEAWTSAVQSATPYSATLRLRGRDGTYRWFMARARPIRDDHGRIVKWFGACTDIHDLTEAQMVVRQGEVEYRAMFEVASVGKAQTDPGTGRFLRVNRKLCEMTGYSADELLTKTFADITHPEDTPRDLEGLRRLVSGELDEYSTEKRYIRKDGVPVWIHLNAAIVRNSPGKEIWIVAVVQDISDRKRAEMEVRELNETLDAQVKERTANLRSLAAELSRTEERERKRLATDLHDNLAQLLALSKMKLQAIEHTSLMSTTGLSEVTGLLNEALTYTRTLLSDLRPPLLNDEHDFPRAMAWVASKLERHGLSVTVLDDGIQKVLDEEVLIVTYQSTHELLMNVLKHARTTEAFLSLRRTGEEVEVVVEDHGIGFDLSGGYPASEDGGFGLLSIRERVQLLGGRFELVSKPGQGTRAKLMMPLNAITSPTARPAQKQDAPWLANGGESDRDPLQAASQIRVLLVDDHRIMREGLRSIIEGHVDLEVVGEAPNGLLAIEAVRHTCPDVVIMDVNMPVMNGVEATRQITREFSAISVIGLSMHEDPKVAVAMKEAGAVGYLKKGDTFERLVDTIRATTRISRPA